MLVCKFDEYKELEELPLQIAYEMIDLAQKVGKVMKKILNNNGIDVEIINYQINGNWSVNQVKRNPLHLHLYGRAKSSVYQKFGEALHLPGQETGFYNEFMSLTKYDIDMIREMLEEISES